MRRREFLTFLGGAAAASIERSGPARAQPKIRRLGVLSQGSIRTHPTPMFRTFQQGLRDLGWVEGQNLAIEWRFSEGSAEPLPRLAAELVGVPVELIVASPTRPALAAKEATSTIPIVFIQVADPIQSGIVTNLARPGANITGLSTIGSDLSGKRLELLKEALPRAERVAVLWNRPSEGSVLVFRELQFSSRELGIELQDIGISDPGELRDAVEFAIRTHVGAIMVIDDPVIASHRPQIVSLASKAALPLFSIYSDYADDGGLMAYGPSLQAIYWRGATYVDRILRGAKPSDLPVEQPSIFELVINLRTAKTLGLELAPTLLARANRVIE
ncbi:MAG TPA: ABC transporter substrate-binding protein [Xanthobacteraceae bacterium]|jgi:putative ABC transport system substrate-binding protein